MEAALPAKGWATPARPPARFLVMDYLRRVHPHANPAHQQDDPGIRRQEQVLWTTTVSWNPADINDQNLKQDHAIVLNSTTGRWLDDPATEARQTARRKALLDFVRSGKGLVGIHGTGDSYHQPDRPSRTRGSARGDAAGRGARAGGPAATAPPDLPGIIATGDHRRKATRTATRRSNKAEVERWSDAWFDKLDTEEEGRGRPDRVHQPHHGSVINPNPAPRGAAPPPQPIRWPA